jgi:hypothetical protein
MARGQLWWACSGGAGHLDGVERRLIKLVRALSLTVAEINYVPNPANMTGRSRQVRQMSRLRFSAPGFTACRCR